MSFDELRSVINAASIMTKFSQPVLRQLWYTLTGEEDINVCTTPAGSVDFDHFMATLHMVRAPSCRSTASPFAAPVESTANDPRGVDFDLESTAHPRASVSLPIGRFSVGPAGSPPARNARSLPASQAATPLLPGLLGLPVSSRHRGTVADIMGLPVVKRNGSVHDPKARVRLASAASATADQ